MLPLPLLLPLTLTLTLTQNITPCKQFTDAGKLRMRKIERLTEGRSNGQGKGRGMLFVVFYNEVFFVTIA